MAEADPSTSADFSMLQLDERPCVKLNRGHLADGKIVGFNSADSRSRAFNLLRTRLLKNLPGPGPRLIGITSATPAAGKSFISVNLALSLARVAEGQVILVDLDLRRGSIATQLGLAPQPGVGDYLAGEATLQEMGVRIDGLPLAVLPTNVGPQDSAELLAGERYHHLVDALRAQPANTIVLFDLPPVFANDDAMLSIERLDAYVLVVDSTETSKSHVVDAVSTLAPATCIGTILNRYKGRMFERYGYGSKAYGAYYET